MHQLAHETCNITSTQFRTIVNNKNHTIHNSNPHVIATSQTLDIPISKLYNLTQSILLKVDSRKITYRDAQINQLFKLFIFIF